MKTQYKSIANALPEYQRYYTVPEAARAIGVPSYKIRRAVKLGIIPSYGVLDRRQYVRIKDIQEAMASHSNSVNDQKSLNLSDVVGLLGGSL
ncbi:helix-turn-helix domain-containing protein [Methylobacterium sp. BTF04]|uniref:helix-turn-helix domain-containing protein n=1 Tax=Methylobacterium sp. BTF04 TaxID=2708300 RepID=UPI0013D15F5D|nr:helix-turn-helix domain-containing protein [Methylobacterium sp. BTF04]NEU14858.1 helix-turn-helix domain-containing protein [Methylobacterium sp. BTF04]